MTSVKINRSNPNLERVSRRDYWRHSDSMRRALVILKCSSNYTLRVSSWFRLECLWKPAFRSPGKPDPSGRVCLNSACLQWLRITYGYFGVSRVREMYRAACCMVGYSNYLFITLQYGHVGSYRKNKQREITRNAFFLHVFVFMITDE